MVELELRLGESSRTRAPAAALLSGWLAAGPGLSARSDTGRRLLTREKSVPGMAGHSVMVT